MLFRSRKLTVIQAASMSSTFSRPSLSIRLLGEVQLMRDEQALNGKLYDKVIDLLAYLIAASDRSHTREHLAAMFWPALPPAAARGKFRQALAYLRQDFPPDAAFLLYIHRPRK